MKPCWNVYWIYVHELQAQRLGVFAVEWDHSFHNRVKTVVMITRIRNVRSLKIQWKRELHIFIADTSYTYLNIFGSNHWCFGIWFLVPMECGIYVEILYHSRHIIFPRTICAFGSNHPPISGPPNVPAVTSWWVLRHLRQRIWVPLGLLWTFSQGVVWAQGLFPCCQSVTMKQFESIA